MEGERSERKKDREKGNEGERKKFSKERNRMGCYVGMEDERVQNERKVFGLLSGRKTLFEPCVPFIISFLLLPSIPFSVSFSSPLLPSRQTKLPVKLLRDSTHFYHLCLARIPPVHLK